MFVVKTKVLHKNTMDLLLNERELCMKEQIINHDNTSHATFNWMAGLCAVNMKVK